MWYLYAMEFYSAMKKNEILSFTGKWMELENIMLSEINQAQRPKIVCSPSYADSRPKTNSVILLNMGHTKGRPCTGRDKGRKPKTLMWLMCSL
jgi:hypothetical protein